MTLDKPGDLDCLRTYSMLHTDFQKKRIFNVLNLKTLACAGNELKAFESERRNCSGNRIKI